MKTQIIVLALSLISLGGMAQEMNKIKVDDRVEGKVLYGEINIEGLNGELCLSWFKPEYKDYKADTGIVSELKKKDLSELKMILVLGTWCHDSHLQVPRMIKLLEEIKFPLSKLKMFAMDTNNKASGIDAKVIDVKLVPTLIVYNETKELGRIIESPKVSLEVDLLEILR